MYLYLKRKASTDDDENILFHQAGRDHKIEFHNFTTEQMDSLKGLFTKFNLLMIKLPPKFHT